MKEIGWPTSGVSYYAALALIDNSENIQHGLLATEAGLDDWFTNQMNGKLHPMMKSWSVNILKSKKKNQGRMWNNIVWKTPKNKNTPDKEKITTHYRAQKISGKLHGMVHAT